MPLVDLPTPTNCWTSAEQKFAEALAASATFQAWGNYASAADAALAIDGAENRPADGAAFLEGELMAYRARAHVFSDLSAPYGKKRINGYTWLPYGVAVIVLQLWTAASELSEDKLPAVTERRLKNLAGSVVDDLIRILESGGPFLKNAQVDEGPIEIEDSQTQPDGKWFYFVLGLDWGREQ
jgi:hypothetical protein